MKFATGPEGQALISESSLFVPVLRSALDSTGFAKAHQNVSNLAVLTAGTGVLGGIAGHSGVGTDRRFDGPQLRTSAARIPARDLPQEPATAPGRGAASTMTSVDTPRKPFAPWRRRSWAGRLFVAPNLTAVAVFMLFPLGFSLYMSFQRWDVFRSPKFVGLRNFHDLFTSDPLFLIALRNTAVFTVGTVVPTVLISLVVAAVLNRNVKGIGIFRTIVFLPLAISSVVMAVVWQFVFNTDNGLLNIMLGWVGIGPVPWLVEPRWAMVSLCIVSVWRACRSLPSFCWRRCKASPKPSTRRRKSTARARYGSSCPSRCR